MLTAFTASLLLVTAAEFGDKTFFVAVLLAMRHSRRVVFVGVWAALILMTLLSVFAGQVLSLLPQVYVHYGEIILFVFFGLKLLYEASQMSVCTKNAEAQEAEELVDCAELKLPKRQTQLAILREAFTLTFVAEWGDRTQITTIALAASYFQAGVIAGSIIGHGICTAIAVVGGRLLAKRISERTITMLAGFLYLIFAGVAGLEGR